MADPANTNRNRKHFFLQQPKHRVFDFSPKLPPFEKKLQPKGQRQKQATLVKEQMVAAIAKGMQAIESADQAIADAEHSGFYLQLKLSDALGFIDGLENGTKNIVIKNSSNLDPEKGILSVVVYVPLKSAEHYKSLADRYAAKSNEQKPTIVDEAIAHIDGIKHAMFRELYTDAIDKLPPVNHVIWWEVWIDLDYKDRAVQVFQTLQLDYQPRVMSFAESCVFLVMASQTQLAKIIRSTDLISEIRLPQKQPGFFLSVLKPHEQTAWIADLIKRRTFNEKPKVKICLLDSGINQKHPLLDGLVPDSHADSHNMTWGKDDQRNHGTPMSSVALYGDLYQHLSRKGSVVIGHGLISIKVLPEQAFPANEPEFYGLIIEESAERADVIDATSTKIICYAITHPLEESNGRPSITSSYIDQLTGGVQGTRRLYVLAAGNIADDIMQANFDAINCISMVEDPGQSWNAITVGGYTDKTAIKTNSDGDEKPLAPAGALSPRSRTSCAWLENWPIKPDVVFEAGNLCYKDSAIPCEWHEDLSLVAASGSSPSNLFTRMADSSAATALAAKMCAEIQTAEPILWPETARALLVHSAEWTTTMREEILGEASKAQRIRWHIRKYGHGVPSLERDLFSMSNDLTMVLEDSIQPFKASASGAIFNQIKLYDLPWPIDALNSIGAADAELKVTLSYFVEPNPGKPIISRKRTYQSCGLQFDIRRPKESDLDFKNRINKLQMLEEGDNPAAVLSEEPASEDGHWALGKRGRNVGSLHSDTWTGSAAALANRGKICIYPRAGWWKHNKKLKRWTSSVRFPLVVSIRTPEQEIDLYSAVETIIKNQISTAIPIKAS